MSENTKISTEEKESIRKSKNWWKWFWITIIFFMIVYIGLIVTASNKFDNLSIEDKQAITTEFITKLQDKFPKLKQVLSTIPEESKESIKKSIDENIDSAYESVYEQIDSFSEFHYSVTGEYTELAMVLADKIDTIIKEKIFDPANFDDALNDSFKSIHSDTNDVLKDYFSDISNEIQNELELDEEETEFFMNEVIKFTKIDMLDRFNSNLSLSFKGFGLAGGAAAGAMTKIMSKKIATMMTKKIATKAAIKGGSKIAGASAGAVVGAESGLFCGPGAWLCSPVGAVIGGTIGWFATDKAVVEIDQYYSEDEFQADLRNMIDEQKYQTKQTLYKIYFTSLDNLAKDNEKSIDNIKNNYIIELIK